MRLFEKTRRVDLFIGYSLYLKIGAVECVVDYFAAHYVCARLFEKFIGFMLNERGGKCNECSLRRRLQ